MSTILKSDKFVSLLIPGIISVVLVGVAIYFHKKFHEIDDKTENILDILTQQQNIIVTHDSVLKEVVLNNNMSSHSSPKTPEMSMTPEMPMTPEIISPKIISPKIISPEYIETPSPEYIESPVKIHKQPDFDKELLEELKELKKQEQHSLYDIPEEKIEEIIEEDLKE